MAASVAAALAAAKAKLGAPYVWGATGPSTFDCSGLTQWAWKQAGATIPRTSQQQAKYGTAVTLPNIQAGDLVTSDWGSGPSSHVALYVGGGQLIHAPKPGKSVTYTTLDANYAKHINAIRRVPGASGAPPSDGAQFAGFTWEDLNSINPLLPGFWDKLVKDGGAAGGLLEGTVLAPLGAMASGLVGIGSSLSHVGTFAEWLMKLALPSTWVRIVSGILGAALLALGLFYLVRETRETA